MAHQSTARWSVLGLVFVFTTGIWMCSITLGADAGPPCPWHHPLYLDGGGYWQGRVRVEVANEADAPVAGSPVVLTVGKATGQLALVGEEARAVRVCNAQGVEMQFAIHNPDGKLRFTGPIPEGSRIVIPVECEAKAKAGYYVYFDNRSAWELPDFTQARYVAPKDEPGGWGHELYLRTEHVGGPELLDFLLQPEQPATLHAEADAPEHITLAEAGADTSWYDAGQGKPAFDHRAIVKVFNFATQEMSHVPVMADLTELSNRMRRMLNPARIAVTHGGRPVSYVSSQNLLKLEARLAARSVSQYQVYASNEPRAVSGLGEKSFDLVAGFRNLLKDPGFEEGEKLADRWTVVGQKPEAAGVALEVVDPGRATLGQRCVKLHVPSNAATAWRGWQQAVPVEPGRWYLVAVWTKCQGIQGNAPVRLNLHWLDPAGKNCPAKPIETTDLGIVGSQDWTWVSGIVVAPQGAAAMRVYLAINTPGTVWFDGAFAAEVTKGYLARMEGRPLSGSEGVNVWPVPAILKVFQDEPVPATIAPAEIFAARNEWEPLQLAVRSGQAMKAVGVEASELQGPQGAKLPAPEITVVGYVPIDSSGRTSAHPVWHRTLPLLVSGDGFAGLWPDALLPTKRFDLTANCTQPLWIMVRVPRDAAPGDYRGEVRLVCGPSVAARVPYRLHIWDFTLPEQSHVLALYDIRMGPSHKFGAKSLREAYPAIVKFMAQRRLCPDTVRPYPVLQLKDGQVTGDFSEFDKAAEYYFDILKFPVAYMPEQYFYAFTWGHPPFPVLGEEPYAGGYPYKDADRGKLRPEYKKVYQACLKLFWDHVKQKGWDKKFVLYIADEPSNDKTHVSSQMKALCQMVHEVDPKIAVFSSTWGYRPEWAGSLDIWGIGPDFKKPAPLQTGSARVWFTTDVKMCIDTPSCAMERLLPYYAFKCGAEGYEFWGISWQTYDPYRFGWHADLAWASVPPEPKPRPLKDWGLGRFVSGEGYLIYPGDRFGREEPVSSMRLEQAREGVEDYEYLFILQELIGEAKAAGKDTAAAEKALGAVSELVSVPLQLRQSTRILPAPGRLYEVRQRVAEQVEALSRALKRKSP